MTRRTKGLFLGLVALAVALAIWVFGGFLWPRPQFERPGTPWSVDSTPGSD